MDGEKKLRKAVHLMNKKFVNIEQRIAMLEREIDIENAQSNSSTARSTSSISAEKSSIADQLARSVTAVVGLKESMTDECRVARWIWTVLFLMGVGATIFYLYRTTGEYAARPTGTTLQVEAAEKHEFLPLLLCPEAWYDTQKALDLGMSIDTLKYSLSYTTSIFEKQILNISAARNEFLSIYASLQFDSLLDYYKAISNDLEPYKPGNISNSVYLCRGCEAHENLEKTLLDDRLCYVFNLKPMEGVLGTYSGVRSVVIRFHDKTMGIAQHTPHWMAYFSSHTDTFLPVHRKVNLHPFRSNTISFTTNSLITLSKPGSPCSNEDPNIYSATKCMTQCHNNLYKEFIKCGLLSLSFHSLYPSPLDSCNHADTFPPKNWTLRKFLAHSEQNKAIDAKAADECVKKCPRQCKRRMGETVFEYDERLTNAAKRGVGYQEGKNASVTILNIKHGAVYREGVTMLAEKYTYSFTLLVNNIGGTFGLFVGATVMTFAQLGLFLLEYFTEKVVSVINRGNRNSWARRAMRCMNKRKRSSVFIISEESAQ